MTQLSASVVFIWASCAVGQNPPITVRAVDLRSTTFAEEWHASWIWGHAKPHGTVGYFRKVISVRPGLAGAWAQVSGDDAYVFYVNGREAKKGAFWWKQTDRIDVTPLLKPGANVLAAEVRNAADPGGWLMELTLAYEDGRHETVVTNADWRFSKAGADGWPAAGFDDASWSRCVEQGRPPATAPWGFLPYVFQGRRTEIRIESAQLPDTVDAGQSVAGRVDIKPLGKLSCDLAFTVRLTRKGEEVQRRVYSLQPSPETWAEGQPLRIELPPLAVSRFVARGNYVLEWSLAGSRLSGQADGVVFGKALSVRNERQGSATPIAIRPHEGAPALLINGRPEFPMWFWQYEITPEDAKAFHAAGIDVLSFCSPQYYLQPGWVGEGKYDYKEFDDIMHRLLKANPDALCMPRIFVGAPEWWIDKHPDQSIKFATGIGWQNNGWGGTKHESFASMPWRRDAGEALARFVRHIRQSPYSDRIIGMHIINGIYGEWHAWSATDIPDTSEPMRLALADHVKAKYAGDVGRLRRAWGDPSLEFQEVRTPTLEERRRGDVGMFRDPARSRKVIDYYECFNKVTVEAIDHFCRIVKAESRNQLFTCVFYSYAPDLNWPQEGDHRAAAMAHRLKSVDAFSSPHSYVRRQLGSDGLFRNYPAALALHGKLFVDEADDRTHLANDPTFTHVKTIEQSISVIRREFANAVTHGVGLWYMDQQGTWFHDPAMMLEIERLKRWGDVSMKMPRGGVAEVAVISSLESEFYLCGRDSGKNAVTFPLYSDQIGELCRSGAPFNWYLIEDLAEGLIPGHKVYIFLDCFYLTPAQRKAIEALKSDGRTLLWFYAPGYVSHDGLEPAAMKVLTGMTFESRAKGVLKAKAVPGLSPEAPPEFGPGKEQSPMFVPVGDGATVWGRYADSNEPAFVTKDMPGWRSVYCGVPNLPAVILRRLFSQAGVHIYSDSGDNLMVNQSWLALHTTTGGKKTIRLPRPSRVFDIIGDRGIGENLREFSVELPQGATGVYRLGGPR